VIQSLFVMISVLGLLAALGTVLARNLVHAALYLIAFFFVIACQFVLLEAEFLAAIQVLVYIGAVAILMMFGIMLTRNIQGDDTTTVRGGLILPALIATVGLFFVLVFGVHNQEGVHGRASWWKLIERPPLKFSDNPSLRAPAINNMGKTAGVELLTRYAVPFEVAGLLLTAGLVGAIALAHRDTGATEPGRALAVGEESAGVPGNGKATAEVLTASTPTSHT
jgi:NADH:ubiquinone oxidoreductase subunit 6 (subunit J)